jgi:hypothetical protein
VLKRPRHVPSFAVVVIVIVAFWGNDYQSCQRSAHVRSSLAISFASQALRAGERAATERGEQRQLDLQAHASDLAALRRVSRLQCLAPWPPS